MYREIRSGFFPVTSGVKQGCVLAPTLFNTCMDWKSDRATTKRHYGATVGNIRSQTLILLMMLLCYLSLETLVVVQDDAKTLGLEI